MYDETNVPGPEYRVRPVVRYAVTRYCHPYQAKDGTHGSPGLSEVLGEFVNGNVAYDVAVAMAASEPRATAHGVIDPIGTGSLP